MRRRITLWGIAASLLIGGVAAADAASQGDQARLRGRWAEAVAAYAEALAESERSGLPEEKRAAILGELGASEVALGRYRDGAEHLHRALAHRESLTREQEARYRAARRKAAAEVATLVIGVDPSDAELLLDGRPIAGRRSSHVLFVEPGQHTLRARLPGFTDAEIRHDAQKGSRSVVALRLVELPRRAAPAQPPSAPGPAAPRRRPAPAAVPEGEAAARFYAPVLISAGASALLGGGLLLGAVAVDDGIEDRASALAGRAGSGACAGGAHERACASLRHSVEARDFLAGAGGGAVVVGLGLSVVGGCAYLWGFGAERRVRVGAAPGSLVMRGNF